MSRGTLRLLAVAGVLVVLVLVFANPFRDIRTKTSDWKSLFTGVPTERADRILVKTATDSTLLVRNGTEWAVASQGGFPADTAAVGNLLRAVKNARSAGIASTNPANHAMFQVDRTGVEVQVWDGKSSLAHFTVGKMGQDFTTSYVLPAGSNEVHVVRGMNRNLFARPQGMRDRTLLKFEVGDVKDVRHEAPSGGWELSRGDSTWTVQALGTDQVRPAASSAVDPILRSLSALSADGFLEGSPDTVDTGLDPPQQRFVVRFADGSEASVSIGKKNDRNQVYVSRPDRQAVYLLGEWRVNSLDKTADELAEKAPETPPAKTAMKPASGKKSKS